MIAWALNQNVSKAARPPRPKKKSRVRSTNARQEALVARMGSAMRIDLVSGIERFKDKVDPDALAAAWAKKDYRKVTELVPWRELPAELEEAMGHLGLTMVASGKHQIETLPPNTAKRLRLDLTNPDIRHHVERRTGALITDLTDGVQQSVQTAVARHFTNALTPRQVAQQIKGSIGLLPAHEIAVANYRRSLTEAGLRPERVEAQAARYEKRLLDYRAMNIARTETRRATQHGQLAVWHEGKRLGLITGGKKVWLVDGDPCEICEPMDDVAVDIEGTWEVEYPNGDILNIEIPSDSHPACQCSQNIVFETPEADE